MNLGISAFVAAFVSTAFSADENAPAPAKGYLKSGDTVLFLGDSITRGGNPEKMTEKWWKEAKTKKYYWHMMEDLKATDPKLAESLTFVHAGFDAQRATGGLKALTVELGKTKEGTPGPSLLERFNPTVVVVCYGMNDGGPTMKAYEPSLRSITAKCKEKNIRVTLMSPPCKFPRENEKEGAKNRTNFVEYVERLGKCMEIVKKIAAEENLAAVDIYTPTKKMMDEGKDWTADGCHPTTEGHRVIADQMEAAWGIVKKDKE